MMYAASTVIALLYAASVAHAGISLPAEPKDKSTPVQQRLSFNGPNAVSVAWNTYEKINKPCVQYGLQQNKLDQTTCSTTSITYPSSRTWSNLVVLKNLKPATTYYYRIGSTSPFTDSFLTPRTPGDQTAFTMATIADLGLYGKDGYTTTKKRDIPKVQPALNHTTIGALAKFSNDYEFIIHPGDIAYADDWIEDPSNFVNGKAAYTAIIETFFQQLAPITARKPHMISPGNHEADCLEVGYMKGVCPEGQYNFSDFQNRYDGMMPTVFPLTSTNKGAVLRRQHAAVKARPPFWYSFDYGMVHVAMINTETDFANAPDAPGGSQMLDAGPFGRLHQQINWLNADLSSVDRTVTPWVIVAGHRPWYTNGDSSTPCGPCQTAFEEVFYKYGVDVGVFGHVHNLQRFVPIHKNKVDPAGLKNPKAPMYTIIGGPGNIEGHSDITPKTTGNVFAYNEHYGFGLMTFHNKTHMTMDFHRSMDGAILDSSTLYKAHNVAFVDQ